MLYIMTAMIYNTFFPDNLNYKCIFPNLHTEIYHERNQSINLNILNHEHTSIEHVANIFYP